MSRNKFICILRYNRFDDKKPKKTQQDKLTPLRKLWKSVMGNVKKCFFLHGEVTVDEQLFPCRSRCAFVQYMPQKPSKFDIKFWMLCNVKTSYVLCVIPYLGKKDRLDDVGGRTRRVNSDKTGQNITIRQA